MVGLIGQIAAGLLLATGIVSAEGQDPNDFTSIPLRTHSLVQPYLDSDLQSRWWDFAGSTIVRADKYVRLTGQQQSQRGWLFSRVPLTATNWEIEVEFNIHGTGHLWGDGMALWLTKERGESGPVFGSRDQFTGLGLFIDTYKNNRPGVVFPYVTAMLGDGNTKYDKDNDGKMNEIGGCSARGLRNAEVPTRLKLQYVMDGDLVVSLAYKKDNHWSDCFTVKDIKLPPVMFLGFSAETGELSDNHDIIKVETKNLYKAAGAQAGKSANVGAAGSKDYSRDKYVAGQKSGGGFIRFFATVVLLILVVVAAYVGWTMYRAQRRDRF